MKKVNRYAGNCAICNGRVPPLGGYLTKAASGHWKPVHVACDAGEKVVTYYSPVTGYSGTRNARGRCEDAPCCGCCTL